MYATDPHSVRQIRRADAIVRAERNRFARWGHPPSITQQVKAVWERFLAPTELDPQLELFRGLDRRSLRRLAERFTVTDLASGESPMRQGEPNPKFVVVLDGQIGVTLDELPVAIFDTGSHFGALPLLDGGPDRFAVATFRALEPTRVAIAEPEDFDQIMKQFPAVALRVRWVTVRRRAYLQGHADAKAMYAARTVQPFPVHAGVDV